MADKSPFVDRKETYMASPEKVKINKNRTTVVLTENTSEKTTSTKTRVSSTSWQITKTTEITDEVKTGQKVSTMNFEISSSGSVSPTSSPGRRSFVSSTEFTTSVGKTDGAVGLSDDGGDPSDEYVFIENEDVNFVDRVETTEAHDKQESIAPEPKKSYFAYLLDQDTSSKSASKNQDSAASEGEDLVKLSSTELKQKKKDDATVYERITYTPGLAIRSYAVEEIKQKRTSEGTPEGITEDAENNNMQRHDGRQTETTARDASSLGEASLTPAEGYRISQIIAMQETSLWEQERLRKEKEEYAIIDSLSMDDMMKMLGEHDRMKFESQEVNEEVFPIIPVIASDGKYSEMSERTRSTERIDTQFSEMAQGSKASVHQESHKTKPSDASAKERTTATNNNHSEMSNPTESGQSTEVKYSEVSQPVTGPTERKHISDAVYSEVSSKVHQIRTDNLSLEQVTAETDIADSPSMTKVVDNRQPETNASSHDQSSMGHAQELKTKMKSFSEQSVSMGPTSMTSSATVVGGVSKITAQKQTSWSPSREEPISQPTEVERKFNITAETESKIKKLGGKLLQERSFSDMYFDNCDYCLTLSDSWLRKRDNKWELKVASEGMSIRDRVTQYKELTNEKEIVACLKTKFQIANECSQVKDFIKSAEMSEFATVSTTHKTYRIADCTIDLDLSDHGFQVGEIEVVAPSSAQIPAAIKTMDAMARKLGLGLNKEIRRKMTDYLKRKNPLFNKLLIYRYVLKSALSDDETDKLGIT